MARINWTAIEREEQEIEDDPMLTAAEKARQIAALHREARDEYEEQQRRERADEFGDWA